MLDNGRKWTMKTDTHRRIGTTKYLIMTTLLLTINLFLMGCGEVVSVEGIDTGGGGANSLMLSWKAPTTNEDGTTLIDLAGFKLYYGTQSGQYSQVIDVGNYNTAEIGDLGSGTYYLAITAYDTYGNESRFSNEIYHTII
jgi:hypothetical protein